MIQVNDRNVYKHVSKNALIFMCRGKNQGLGWCLCSNDCSTFKRYSYGKIMHLKKQEMKVEYSFSSFSLESGSTANEPWQAGTYTFWEDSNKKAIIACAS